MAKFKLNRLDRDPDRWEKVGKMRKARRSQKAHRSQDQFQLEEGKWPPFLQKDYFVARVVEIHKRYCFVSREPTLYDIDTSDIWLATVARKFLDTKKSERNFVAVGDRVLCLPEELDNTQPAKKLPEWAAKFDKKGADDEEEPLPQCVIQHLAPRTAEVARIDPISKKLSHVLAANVHQMIVVTSFLNPRIRFGLIDRYLVLAEQNGIDVVLVFNKADLLKAAADKPRFVDECHTRVQIYRDLGYRVFVISANEDKAPWYNKIKALLGGKISLVTGHSGVGKSTFVNLFDPEIVQEVEKNLDIFYKGRHTTTYAAFIKLGTGGYVIDTPGIRSFAMDIAGRVADGFREFAIPRSRCRYRECRHLSEPECGVQDAVADGTISPYRYDSYKRILLGDSGRDGKGDREYQESGLKKTDKPADGLPDQ